MALKDSAAQLGKFWMFSGCSKRELDVIARAAKEVTHKAGTVIAREGERGVGFFFITEGEAKVTIGGKTKTKLGPGDFFGEIALLDADRRTASVVARSDVQVIVMHARNFRSMAAELPQVAERIWQAISERLGRS